MKRTYIIIILLFAILLVGLGGTYYALKKNKLPSSGKPSNEPTQPTIPEKPEPTPIDNDAYTFNLKIIKGTNELADEDNYLISPYSIEVALNLLKKGANGDTLKELEDLVPDRTINDLIIKDKIGVANALFIKDRYKDYVENKFMQELQTKYNSDIIYDAFITPNKINDWTKEKTNGMIPKLIDQLDPEFVLGVANAIAIDVEWQQKFECESTREGEFKVANETKKVEMMHKTYESGTKYFKTENAEGVIIPYASYDKETGEMTYENGKQLEFIGILPNNDVKEYISNLDANELQNIDNNTEVSSRTVNIKVSLPRFTYDFDYKKFALLLHNLGMTKAFDPANADFTNIITRENHEKAGLNNIYVGEAIHMTHIELNESGTKAAAVTAFLLKDNAAIFEEEIKYINVNFNKPFIYMIRDKETKEMLFFGTVYNPNEWKGSTCEDE